jgi:very-short-patch-repair endonuclease
MIRASDLSAATRAKLGIAEPKRGRPKQDESANKAFMLQCLLANLPPMLAQWRFTNSKHPNAAARKWRCDFVFQDYMVMVEIDGGIFIRGAHGHPTDILRNMRKQNDAMLLGYTVLRFTPAEARNGTAWAFTQRVLEAKGWRK